MRAPTQAFRWIGLAAYAGLATLIILFLTPIGGWKALDVLTGSMRPAIQPGALVIIHRVPLSSVHPGNVVTYVNPHDTKELITHRVQSVNKVNGVTMVTVKGDANTIADPPFAGGQIQGRVATIVPYAGRVLNVIHNPYGLALLVILPALFVIWIEARRLMGVLVEESDPATPGSGRSGGLPVAIRFRRPREIKQTDAGRPLDGMRRLAVLPVVAIALAVFAVGVTLAALTSTVSLTGNSFQTQVSGSPSPTPSPSGSPTPSPSGSPTPSGSPSPTASPCPTNVSITDTGAGSTNIVRCTSKTIITNSNSNNVSVTNSNHQSTSGGGSSTNTQTTNINVTY